ncbi:MAG: hypothetical protein ABSH50_28830 [Bryobacteraceae bacterium]|jgi:hypothetical protein
MKSDAWIKTVLTTIAIRLAIGTLKQRGAKQSAELYHQTFIEP